MRSLSLAGLEGLSELDRERTLQLPSAVSPSCGLARDKPICTSMQWKLVSQLEAWL